MTPQSWALHIVRKAFIASRFHRLLGQAVSEAALRVSLLSSLSRFAHEHPVREFNRTYYTSRTEMYRWLIDNECLGAIDYLEFGVASGTSIKWWAEAVTHSDARFIGFDVFTGLPEAWGSTAPPGAFDQGGRAPIVEDPRVSFEVGHFQDSLPSFLPRFAGDRRMVVHLDADLYSSTLFVLASLASRMKPGDLLIFDEFGALRTPEHEFSAFLDFQSAFRVSLEPIAASSHFQQVAFRVKPR